MPLGDDDIGAFFTDFAVPLVFSGAAASGLVDSFDQSEGNTPMIDFAGRITDVTVPSNAWSPFPKKGSTVTVDGVDMKVRDLAQEKDGAITHLYMVKP